MVQPVAPPSAGRFAAFDVLATLVAVLQADGSLAYANSALEDALGISRRLLVGQTLASYFVDAAPFVRAWNDVSRSAFSAIRYDAQLRRMAGEPLPVHVILTHVQESGEVVVEMVSQEQQTRQEREERLAEQAQTNKELIRNLAHEIKNPLGGIRGAAQLLEMEVEAQELKEYTQVIIREADRLQSLVDRLLAPHRKPHVVGDVNIHEVCERVRSLILAEFPKGLKVVRDYDISLPEFRGDIEQLIQAVLNIAHNACQALAERRAAGDAMLTFKTRALRQITLGKTRYKLALELHVIDNGPGIPDSIKDRIFYPLVSGRDGGSGLGLTLAQNFVQQHHGVIEVDSVPGRTDFTLVIPLP
ncbi:nitrogen regulation protein NR(II) [Curvibacter sp. APW13]|nr:nitrogen regulation protein NR(II) [Curvibacter sp. APW13]MDT8990943.1 nitrogen regulation protein NR(II) [Curvibacter sp. APW13]